MHGRGLGDPAVAWASRSAAALRVGVVLQWRDDGVRTRDGDDVVGVGDGRKAPGSADIHGDLSFGGGLAVGDCHGQDLAARCGAGVLEGEQAVGPDPDLVLGIGA